MNPFGLRGSHTASTAGPDRQSRREWPVGRGGQLALALALHGCPVNIPLQAVMAEVVTCGTGSSQYGECSRSVDGLGLTESVPGNEERLGGCDRPPVHRLPVEVLGYWERMKASFPFSSQVPMKGFVTPVFTL